jgi:hypothetical protein
VFDEVVPRIPLRSGASAAAELDAIRAERRHGGRRRGGRRSPPV